MGSIGLGLGGALLCTVFIAASTGADAPRKWLAWVVSLIALASPLLVSHELPFARFMVLMVGVCIFGRTLDLTFRGSSFGFWGRVWMLLTIFDARESQRDAPALDGREVGWLALHIGIFVAGLAIAWALAPQVSGNATWAVRWLGALAVSYGMSESLQSSIVVGYRLGGICFPRVNDFPVVSLTLSEFWGRRWNRTVSKWLYSFAFLPVTRRLGVLWGTGAAFAASTALHFWTAAVPLDWIAGIWMGSFFVIQGLLVALERPLRVSAWPPPLRRTWTLAWLVVTSPLFCEPMLQILESLRG